VIAPAAMSLSMASCLPGIASSAKRAPTSAMRAAPFVMTMKLTIRRTQNTTRPSTMLPPITNIANPSMTSPAASVPVWPSPMISFVDETLSDSRRTSDASRIVGKAEKSSGRWMKSVTVNIRIASAKEAARPTSSTQAGIGRIIMTMTAISASASRIVGWNRVAALRITRRSGSDRPRRSGGRPPRSPRDERGEAPVRAGVDKQRKAVVPDLHRARNRLLHRLRLRHWWGVLGEGERLLRRRLAARGEKAPADPVEPFAVLAGEGRRARVVGAGRAAPVAEFAVELGEEAGGVGGVRGPGRTSRRSTRSAARASGS
jgi:hypothetical protein